MTRQAGAAAMADERSRLGRGLAALIGDVGSEPTIADATGRKPRRAPIEKLSPNPRNPRRTFADQEIAELSASIRERGIIQPIVVRSIPGHIDRFEIIAGERRWRAAQRAELHDVPIVVVDATDAQALELAIIENVQRADLNAIEEAMGYQALADEFNHSHDAIAQIVGKSRSHVANTVRLLKLPDAVRALVAGGKLTAGHARMLVGHANAGELADDIVKHGLNVRQVEALVAEQPHRAGKTPRAAKKKDSNTLALERHVSDALGLVVSIDHKDKGGQVKIVYRDLEQLDEITRRLTRR